MPHQVLWAAHGWARAHLSPAAAGGLRPGSGAGAPHARGPAVGTPARTHLRPPPRARRPQLGEKPESAGSRPALGTPHTRPPARRGRGGGTFQKSELPRASAALAGRHLPPPAPPPPQSMAAALAGMRGRAAGRWSPQGGGPRARPSAGGAPGHQAYTKAGRALPGLPAGRRAARPAAWASRAPPGRRERRRRFPGTAPLGPRLPIHRQPGRLRRSPRRGPPGREVGGERTHTPPLVPGRKMAAPGAPRPPRPSGAPGPPAPPQPPPLLPSFPRFRAGAHQQSLRDRQCARWFSSAAAAARPPLLPHRRRSRRAAPRAPPQLPRRGSRAERARRVAPAARPPQGRPPRRRPGLRSARPHPGRRGPCGAAGERGRGPAAAAPRAAAPRRPRVRRRRRTGWNRAWEVARGLHACFKKLPKLSFGGKKPLFMCLRPESPMSCFARQPRRCSYPQSADIRKQVTLLVTYPQKEMGVSLSD
ncbi:basic salivary proline-rich protein 1-like [Manis pentadactyla]|uniref:basic salivary proline-rich protein 1-like n=1 Tax=Manis pentadactyla TaxID=143292 RepID=UPI00255C7BC3|nr:basic salivary proline-rich protein 1-like [Manis pentadactyla]